MKKKILLVGELGEVVRSLNECLSGDFAVQLCSLEQENLRSMIKIVKPDLIVLCHIGAEKVDSAIFELFLEKCPKLPVLGITTSEGWEQCRNYYERKGIDALFRPVVKSELLKKCYRLLEMSYESIPMEEPKTATVSKKKIMIVDDSALLLRTMKSMLEKYYEIRLAKSGEQALKMLEKEKADLVLLDYEMEGMDGRCTFEAMREDENLKSVPVVFLTSVANRQSVYSVLKSIPDGYILKPPDEKRIRETIEEILKNTM